MNPSKKQRSTFYLRLMSAGLVSSLTLACSSSSSNVIHSMNLSVSQATASSDSLINLSAEVDLGNLTLPSFVIPIQDPRTQLKLGQVSLGTASDGKPLITMSLDETAVLHADSTLGATLPNGNPIPGALGVPSGELLAFPILQYSRVYIGGDLKNKVYAGVALSIQQLDAVAGNLGGGNIFFSKSFGPVNGVAGLFTSATPHETGIAVFASGTIPHSTTTTTTIASTSASSKISNGAAVPIALKVASITPMNRVPAASVPVAAPVATSAETMHPSNMDQNLQLKMYQYFHGQKRALRPQ